MKRYLSIKQEKKIKLKSKKNIVGMYNATTVDLKSLQKEASQYLKIPINAFQLGEKPFTLSKDRKLVDLYYTRREVLNKQLIILEWVMNL